MAETTSSTVQLPSEVSSESTGDQESSEPESRPLPHSVGEDTHPDLSSPTDEESLHHSTDNAPCGSTTIDNDNTKKNETPRVAFSYKKRYLLVEAMIHTVPIAITILLLSLHASRVYWPAPGPNSNVLSILQLAAKAHESLIAFSLSTIVFHRIRFELFGSRGVPLGLLGSVFQLGSIPYHFSKEFWNCLNLKQIKKRRFVHLLTVTLLLTSFVLTNLAGPASAILMIPKLKWWTVSNTEIARSYTSLQNRNIFTIRDQDVYYPLHVSGTFPELCNIDPSWQFCPSADFTTIVFERRALNPGIPTNVTVSGLDIPRVISSGLELPRLNDPVNFTNPDDQLDEVIVFTTTPTLFISSGVQWKFGLDNVDIAANQLKYQTLLLETDSSVQGQIQQPMTFVHCTRMDYPVGPSRVFQFSTGLRPAFNLTLSVTTLEEMVGNTTISNVTSNSGNFAFSWISLDGQPIQPASLASITWEYRFGDAFVCLIDAFWSDSQITYSPGVTEDITATLPPATFFSLDSDLNYSMKAPERKITMDIDWATSLNVPNPVQGGINATVFDYMSLAYGDDLLAQTAFLSNYFSNALAYHSLSVPGLDFWSQDPQFDEEGDTSGLLPGVVVPTSVGYQSLNFTGYANSNFTLEQLKSDHTFQQIDMTLSRHVYGYGFDDPTTCLALVVLLVHLLLVLGHVAILIGYRSWTSTAWSGLGDFLALAFSSSPSRLLQHTSAGIKSSSIWRLNTYIREVIAEDRLELVVREEMHGDTEKGVNSLGLDSGLAFPRADHKYS